MGSGDGLVSLSMCPAILEVSEELLTGLAGGGVGRTGSSVAWSSLFAGMFGIASLARNRQ